MAVTTASGAHPTVLTGCCCSALCVEASLDDPCFFNTPRALLEDTSLVSGFTPLRVDITLCLLSSLTSGLVDKLDLRHL